MKRSTASRGAFAILVAVPLLPVCGIVVHALLVVVWGRSSACNQPSPGRPINADHSFGAVPGRCPRLRRVAGRSLPKRERVFNELGVSCTGLLKERGYIPAPLTRLIPRWRFGFVCAGASQRGNGRGLITQAYCGAAS
jgi:hypothetical protein